MTKGPLRPKAKGTNSRLPTYWIKRCGLWRRPITGIWGAVAAAYECVGVVGRRLEGGFPSWWLRGCCHGAPVPPCCRYWFVPLRSSGLNGVQSVMGAGPRSRPLPEESAATSTRTY